MARDLKGWTQQEVVQRVVEGGVRERLSSAALSQLENGHTRPTPSTLLALAAAYRCPLGFFVRRIDDDQPEGFFRSLRSMSARSRNQYLVRVHLLHDLVRVVETRVRLPQLDVPRVAVGHDDRGAVEAAAAWVRRKWDLPSGPIDNMVQLLERHGVVVVRAPGVGRDVDAFSVRYNDRPIVVLGSGKGVTTRSRFDAAHELGHLVLHDVEDAGTKQAEVEAHQFAAAFLMPERDIKQLLPGRDLMNLKTQWRVSMQALLFRAKTLEAITPAQYTNAMKTFSARGWRTQEPGDDQIGSLEAPRLLELALDRVYSDGTTLDDLCDDGALPLTEVRSLLDLTADERPRIDL